jgi:hypothetical protein
MTSDALPSSFRDPSGFLFRREGVLYRQINTPYRDHYDRLMTSGLYGALVKEGLLVPHAEVAEAPAAPEIAYKVIAPEPVPFISYPYEWCFSQLKNAALATLAVHKKALECGMSLKDASAYNIQFVAGRPMLIDTLSFEAYREGAPWVAYRQFCQHFLAPLALMARTDVRLGQLLRVHIDGIPLDLASRLLPARTKLSFGLLTHIHGHAKFQVSHEGRDVKASGRKMSRMALLGLVDNLESTVRKLAWRPGGTEWAEYYTDTNYTDAAFAEKHRLAGEFLDACRPRTVWDLGANVGVFSRIASGRGAFTVAFDVDPAAVEKNYLECVAKKETNLLPLLMDLANPSASIGWANSERMSLAQRGPADAVMALALVHHLAISNNVPLGKLADFFAQICHSLIIEFVPKTDSQVKRLLVVREDIFKDYTREAFEREFQRLFAIERRAAVTDSQRTLYLMRRTGR